MYFKNTFWLCTKGQVITPNFWSSIVGDLTIFEQSNMESLLLNEIGYISSDTFTAKTFYLHSKWGKNETFLEDFKQENSFRERSKIVKRFQDLLPKCPRKMSFENVMKMISESLRFQEIVVDI